MTTPHPYIVGDDVRSRSSSHRLMMRIENIRRRVIHSLRRTPTDAFIQDNLEAIKHEADHALLEAHDLLGISNGGASAAAEPTSAASPSPSRGEGRGEGFTATPQPEAMIH
jgi:hypothetical protein